VAVKTLTSLQRWDHCAYGRAWNFGYSYWYWRCHGTANTTDHVADASDATDAAVVSGPVESEPNLATCHPHYSVQPAPPV